MRSADSSLLRVHYAANRGCREVRSLDQLGDAALFWPYRERDPHTAAKGPPEAARIGPLMLPAASAAPKSVK
jgi:hypothetical protein